MVLCSETMLILLIQIIIIPLLPAVAAREVYVKPNEAVVCKFGEQPCRTLEFYTENQIVFFREEGNLTLTFLPGIHYCVSDINISSRAMVTFSPLKMSSGFDVTISFHQDFTLAIDSLIIRSITFTNYGTYQSKFSIQTSELYIFSSIFSVIEGVKITVLHTCTFTNSKFADSRGNNGGALYVYGSSENSQLSVRNCSFDRNIGEYGGAFFVENAKTIVENSLFTDNAANVSGGAVYVKGGTYTDLSSEYTRNRANLGAAVFVEKGNMTISNCYAENNTAMMSAGFIYLKHGTLSCSYSYFKRNRANYGGLFYIESVNCFLSLKHVNADFNKASSGGLLHVKHGDVDIVSSKFVQNQANIGGTVYIEMGIITMLNCSLYNNSALKHGGVFYAHSAKVSNFSSNYAELHGGVAYLSLELHHCSFLNNHAEYGGVGFMENGEITSVNGMYRENHVTESGGIWYIRTGTLKDNSSHFWQNSAQFGSITFTEKPNSTIRFDRSSFDYNSASASGGTIFILRGDLVQIFYCSFYSNRASRMGGAIYSAEGSASLIIIGSTCFENNAATNGGALNLANSKLSVTNSHFESNQVHNIGGAIHLSKQSTLMLHSKISFRNNSAASSGGALSLRSSLLVISSSATKIYFNENKAGERGGAIFYRDDSYSFSCYSSYVSGQTCLYQVNGTLEFNRRYLYLDNNTAPLGGFLYGGLLNRCKFNSDTSARTGIEVIKQISSTSDYLGGNAISSDAVRVCHCVSMVPNCTFQPIAISVWRGEVFNLSLATLDQNNNTISSEVISGLDETKEGKIYFDEYTQVIGNICTNVSFHIYSNSSKQTLYIYANGPCKDADDDYKVSISVNLRPHCPTGFEGERKCGCDGRLLQFTNSCNIDNQTIVLNNLEYWIDFQNSSLLYSYCPLDYCTGGRVVLTVNNTDQQCKFNRSGKLCGSCKENFSNVLGSSSCIVCSSTRNAIWLTVVFGIAGVLLVLVLFLCKLTVSEGTINGLIFYANIIAINKTDYFGSASQTFSSIFIDWLNLDFGIEMCFYNNLTTYQWVWLQYSFPLYLWLLVAFIVITTHKCSRVMKVLGRNLIPVLSTLFLLSYTKLLRIAAVSLSFATVYTSIDVSQTTSQLVWTPNGNIQFLKGRHIPMFTVGMFVFIFLFSPYTILLLFGQCLRMLPGRRWLAWVNGNTIIFILDSYHAPYRSKHRFWTGLLLLVRCIVFAAASYREHFSINLIATLVGTSVLLLYKWVIGPVYKRQINNKIEDCFLLTLLVSTALTLHYINNSFSRQIIMKVSVGVTVFIFSLILLYHFSLLKGKCSIHAIRSFVTKNSNGDDSGTECISKELQITDRSNVPQTFIDLREPLLTQ